MTSNEEPDVQAPFGVPVDVEWVENLDDLPHDIVLMPEAMQGDVGVYRDEHIAFAKTLIAEGVDAGFLHDADHRTFSGRKGGPILIPLVISIAANVTTGTAAFAVRAYLKKVNPDADVHLTVIRKRRRGLSSSKDVFKARGSGPEVAKLYEEFETNE